MSSTPFLLDSTIQYHLKQYKLIQPDLVQKLRMSIYMYIDNLVSGADDKEQANQTFMNSREILKEGHFYLLKICSNSASLRSKVDPDTNTENAHHGYKHTVKPKETYTFSMLRSGQELHSGEQKVLGIRWDVCSDQVVVNLNEVESIV